MEQMINFVLGACGSVLVGVTANLITDKIKNHSSIDGRKSGYDFEFKLLEIKFKKK